jgi:hypothetical protein
MPDNFSPDVGQHVDPQGHVTYDFDAHIHARGLDLDAGASNTPPADRRVRWLRTSDGAALADVFGFDDGLESGLFATATNVGNGSKALATVRAISGTHQADLTVFTESAGNPAGALDTVSVGASSPAGAKGATIITGDGRSNFVQLISLQALYADIRSANFSGVPAGPLWGVSAPVPWTHTHNGAAILHVNPSAAWGFTIHPRVDSVDQIEFVIANNPVTQDFAISWITFGN